MNDKPMSAVEMKRLISLVLTGPELGKLLALSLLKIEWQRQVKQ